jgi:hypothetical protein
VPYQKGGLLEQIQAGKQLKHVEMSPKEKRDEKTKPVSALEVIREEMAKRRDRLKYSEEEEESDTEWGDEDAAKPKAEDAAKPKAEDDKIDALIQTIDSVKKVKGKKIKPVRETLEKEIFDKLKKLKAPSIIDDSTLTKWINHEKIFDAIEKLKGHKNTLAKLKKQLTNKKAKTKKEVVETTSQEKTKEETKKKERPLPQPKPKPDKTGTIDLVDQARKLKEWNNYRTPLPISTTEEDLRKILELLTQTEFNDLKKITELRLDYSIKKPTKEEAALLRIIQFFKKTEQKPTPKK